MNEFSGARARRIAIKLGESPSSLDWGYGDAVELEDGAITATDTTLTSATASFGAADVGKTICVIGAGAAGVPLTTTIATVTSSTEVELTDAAGTTVSGADFVYGTDNTATFIAGIVEATNRDRAFTIVGGKYLLTGQVDMEDLSGFDVTGQGGSSILIPVSSLTDNLFDCSGCVDGEYSHFSIDGFYLRKASLMLSALYGDGTATNPTYGNIRVRGLRIKNWEQQGIGIGANLGYTVEDIEITDNYFEECGVGWIDGSFGGGPIDTGSGGTGRRYKVMRNKIRMAATSTLHVDAIFCGHGKKYDFLVCDNQIFNPSGHGIQFHARPFVDADVDCEFDGAIVKGNLIRGAGSAAIGNLGASRCQIVGNTIIDPCSIVGHATNAITVSHAITSQDPSEVNGDVYDIQIADNIITDTRVSPSMEYGIRVSAVDVTATGIIDGNLISNYGTDQILWENNQSNFTTRLVNPGGQTHNWATKHTHYAANVGTQTDETNTLGNWLIQQAASLAGNYKLGYGINAQFDGSNWVTGADGGSNGAVILLGEYGGTHPKLRIYTIPPTGGTAQTISTAALEGYLRATLDDDNLYVYGDGTNFIGPTGQTPEMAFQKAGALGASNVQFKFSHRSNGQDFYLLSYDGLSFINWLKAEGSTGLLVTDKDFKIGTIATSRTVKSNNGKLEAGGKISLTTADDVAATGIATGSLLSWDGSKVAAASSLTANRVVATIGTGGALSVLAAMTSGNPVVGAGDGTLTSATWTDVYNSIKSAIEADFVSHTEIALSHYTAAEVDTLLSSKTDQGDYAAHTHSIPDHTHGGVTAGAASTSAGGAGTTGTP